MCQLKKLATIAFVILSQTVFAQLDSLKILFPLDTLSVVTYKLDSVVASARNSVDSVSQYYKNVTAKVQSLSSRYQQKADSLRDLKLTTTKYTTKLDSLNIVLIETKQKVADKIQSIKQRATEKINSLPLPPELQAKVSQLTGSIDRLNLSSFSSQINSPIDFNDLNTSLDQIIPSTNLTGISVLPSLVGVPDIGKSINEVSDITSGVSEQMGALPEGANQINQLDKLAESQVSKLDGVKELSDATSNLPINPMTSEEEAKKQMLNQAKEIAVDHFAGKQDVLKSAIDQISKYKQKFSSISSLSEITKRPPNPMKGKPLIERIVPGIQFQIFQKQGNFLTDFNLYAGFRFNARLTTGLGWNQRIAYNVDRDQFNPNARIFGPRAFCEFKLGRGFSPRVEIEVMNTIIPALVSSARADQRNREWVVSGLVGIKKEYRFYKRIKGTTTIMLNVFHPRNKSPYPDWVITRFGFEFPLRKKRK